MWDFYLDFLHKLSFRHSSLFRFWVQIVLCSEDLWRIDASAELKHQCLLPYVHTESLIISFKNPFFPRHRTAACPLHLFQNRPPARQKPPFASKQIKIYVDRFTENVQFTEDNSGNMVSWERKQEHGVHITAFIANSSNCEGQKHMKAQFTKTYSSVFINW